MKKNTPYEDDELNPRTIAVLSGIALTLGMLVHEVFLLIAAAIATIVPLQWLWRHLRRGREKSRPTYRHA